ncbi:MAG: hypothetical protein ACRD1K_16850 [Acidimicrobiales bacterium]
MFIQVVRGTTNDEAGLARQLERWLDELGSGATGFLGTTGGVAEDGMAIFMARFDSEEAARANSDRPEQGAWWNETAKYFDGEVVFRDCPDVDVTLAGGSDAAGFVQIMQGRAIDRPRLAELEADFLPKLSELRPDVIGSIRAWDGDFFTDAIYFTSEEAAREGEARMAEAPGVDMGEFMALIEDLSFVDLKRPWLSSP